ncbi:MAG: hypothetical protein VB860_04580 [Dehalococcoidia bacterium]|jgi:hypothetical protein
MDRAAAHTIQLSREEGQNMGDWITDHKFTTVIVPIVIGTILAFPIVIYAPTWFSTTYVIVLSMSPILAVIWFFRSM